MQEEYGMSHQNHSLFDDDVNANANNNNLTSSSSFLFHNNSNNLTNCNDSRSCYYQTTSKTLSHMPDYNDNNHYTFRKNVSVISQLSKYDDSKTTKAHNNNNNCKKLMNNILFYCYKTNIISNNSNNNKNWFWNIRFFMWSISSITLFILILRSNNATSTTSAAILSNNYIHNNNMKHALVYQQNIIQYRIELALWSYFAGDALASPTHWFYGGLPQIQQYYGSKGIVGYTRPVMELKGSILNKSNLSGGGRSTTTMTSSSRRIVGNDGNMIEVPPTIIGYVINHGKQEYWDPNKNINYHATLHAGESTLEVQLARVLMKSISENNGQFDSEHFRNAYIQFMTKPGSHNDTYASTCHRMYFANLIYKQLSPIDCPDNDSHNVDTIDGLVLPTITALSVAARIDGTIEEARMKCAETAAVTRRSKQLEQYAAAWGEFIFTIIRSNSDGSSSNAVDIVHTAANHMAQTLQIRRPEVRRNDEITACYLNSAVPAMLDTIVKYTDYKTNNNNIDNQNNQIAVWNALLMNANTGGENVHRGSCLGAVLGAAAAAANNNIPIVNIPFDSSSSIMMTGLYDYKSLQKEIHDFIQTTTTTPKNT